MRRSSGSLRQSPTLARLSDQDIATSTAVVAYPDGAATGEFGDDDSSTVSLNSWSGTVSFFNQGVEHIRFSPDDLLFLLVVAAASAAAFGVMWTLARLGEIRV